MSKDKKPGNNRWKRIGWFLLIWACSVAALGIAAFAMRMLMRVAGLTAG